MKILISGVTGFICNHTTAAWLVHGHEIVATARHKPRKEKLRWLPEVEFIPCDLHTPSSASALLANARLVERHIAARGASIRLNRGHYPYPTHEPMLFWGDSAKLDKIINPA